jgi:hypothetical protein
MRELGWAWLQLTATLWCTRFDQKTLQKQKLTLDLLVEQRIKV